MSNDRKILIVFAFLLVVMIAYIGYDKLINNSNINFSNNDTNIGEGVSEDAAIIFYSNLVKNRQLMVDYDNDIEIILDKNGEVYYSADNGLGSKGKYKIDGYEAGIDANGEMSNVFNGYKLSISGVVAIYHVIIGNGGWQGYILIKDDGTIARLTYSAYEDFTTKKTVVKIEEFEETVSGYKNIVAVVDSDGFGAHGYKLIDINGNIY